MSAALTEALPNRAAMQVETSRPVERDEVVAIDFKEISPVGDEQSLL